jgi:hypothetical protein
MKKQHPAHLAQIIRSSETMTHTTRHYGTLGHARRAANPAREAALQQARPLIQKLGALWLRECLAAHKAATLSALPDDVLRAIVAAPPPLA